MRHQKASGGVSGPFNFPYVNSDQLEAELEKVYRHSANPTLHHALHGPDAPRLEEQSAQELELQSISSDDVRGYGPAAALVAEHLKPLEEQQLDQLKKADLKGLQGIDSEKLVRFMRLCTTYHSRRQNEARITEFISMSHWVLRASLNKRNMTAGSQA